MSNTTTPPSWGDPVFVGTSGPDTVQRINESDGSVEWNTSVDAAVGSHAITAWNGTYVFAGTTAGTVYRLNRTDGSVVNTYNAPAGVQSMDRHNNTLYLGLANGDVEKVGASNFYTLDSWDGVHGSATGVTAIEATHNGFVYTGGGDDRVVKTNASLGSTVWNVSAGADVTSLSYTAEALVVTRSASPGALGLNRSTGAQDFSWSTGTQMRAGTNRSGVEPVVGDTNGEVVVLEPDWSAEKWNRTVNGSIYSVASGNNERVYTGGIVGSVQAIQPDGGAFDWNTTLSGSPTVRAVVIDNTTTSAPSSSRTEALFGGSDANLHKYEYDGVFVENTAVDPSAFASYGESFVFYATNVEAAARYPGNFTQAWSSTQINGSVVASDVGTNGDFYAVWSESISGPSHVVRFNKSTGAIEVNQTFASKDIESLDAGGGYVFIGDRDGNVTRLAESTLTEDGSREITTSLVVELAADDENLYVGAYDGEYWSLHQSNLTDKWTGSMASNIQGSGTAVNGDALFGDRGGTAVRLDNQTGAEEWNQTISVDWIHDLGPIDTDVAYGDNAGTIGRLDGQTGAFIWNDSTGDNAIYSVTSAEDFAQPSQPPSVSATGGIHTTDTDFNAADELTNMSVSGTGEPADVVADDYPATYRHHYDVSGTDSGWVDVTAATDVSIEVEWRGDSNGDGNYGTPLNSTTLTSAQNKTLRWSTFEGDSVQVTIDVTSTGSTFTLADEGVTIDTSTKHAPVLNNGSASPDSTSTEDNRATLSIDASDGDFPDDTVEVEFFVNGSSVGTDTLTSNGTASVLATNLGPGTKTWNATATDKYGFQDTSADFMFDVVHHAPIVNNSSAVPTGGINKDQDSLDIWVGDRDFDDSTGDQVDVVFTHNGVVVGTETVTSNGTVEYDEPTDLAGPNEWSVTATDSYSLSTTSQTFTYTLPDTVTIYNESDPLVPIQNASAEVEFYFDRDSEPDLIDFRNGSNGTLNMTGLPADEDFVIVVRADGYYNRRVWFPSLLQQQNMYLLPKNETAVQPTFTLIDFTGEFEREQTVLQIQRGLNESWETVEGDYFGAANQMSAQLAYNERHRLIVVNTVTNRSRELGSFTPTASTTIELEVHQNNSLINEEFYPTVQFEPDIGSLPGTTGVNVSARILANGNDLDEYSVHFVTSDGTSLIDQTYMDDGGVKNYTLDLSPHQGQTATFWLNWTTADGVSENVSTTYVIDEAYPNEYSLLSIVLGADLGGETPNALSVLIVLVLSLFATAYAATMLGSGPAGLVGMAVAFGGALVGWIPFTWLVATGLAWIVLAGVRNRI